MDENYSDDIVVLPIDGVLDLHGFRPGEIKSLVMDYLDECEKCRIFQVRIIHGKGRGVQRRIVHGVLERRKNVVSYRLGGHGNGGWGATVVTLKDEDGLDDGPI